MKTFSRGILRELESEKENLIKEIGLTSHERKIFDEQFETFHYVLRRKFALGKLAKLMKCRVFSWALRHFMTEERISSVIEGNKSMKKSESAYREAASIFLYEESSISSWAE